MCLAVPMKIIEINGQTAILELSGIKKQASITLLEDPKIGDYVLIHAGFAIQKVNPKDAKATLSFLNDLAQER